jgi:phosphotriesterase-related protein
MPTTPTRPAPVVNTVLGPIPPGETGVTSVHESLLSVLPGAQYGFDTRIDRAEVFDGLVGRLHAFREAGGGTIVDASGLDFGRDLPLYEALSAATGVHIVASTGLGPEDMLGGYFLTPQTNPPTPWPAERFAELFEAEVSQGMVVPRLERRAPAGLIATAVNRVGMTETERSLVRGAARAARSSGAALSLRYGNDAVRDVNVALKECLPAERIVVRGLDRADIAGTGQVRSVAACGVYLAIDHVGSNGATGYIDDAARVRLVADLIGSGFGNRILLSCSATGAAVGHPGIDIPFSYLLTDFVPMLSAAGIDDTAVRRMLVGNPAELLSVRAAPAQDCVIPGSR